MSDGSVWLVKYQALGNDYLLLDRLEDLEQVLPAVPRLCDRHRGVGADGLVVLDPTTFSVRIFNPDGSEAEKSGNGLRIAACHAVLHYGVGGEFWLRTSDRANQVRVQSVDGAEVVCELDIGRPRFQPDEWLLLETPAGRAHCRLVDVGNPHCVVFGEPATRERCLQLGPHLERHPRFPQRTNVQLVEPVDRHQARVEVWERGAGYTLASGTSASAVAAALIHLGLADSPVRVAMPGGVLSVRQLEDGSLLQSGPARLVFWALVRPSDLE